MGYYESATPPEQRAYYTMVEYRYLPFLTSGMFSQIQSHMIQVNITHTCMHTYQEPDSDAGCTGGPEEPDSDAGCTGEAKEPDSDAGCTGGPEEPDSDAGCTGEAKEPDSDAGCTGGPEEPDSDAGRTGEAKEPDSDAGCTGEAKEPDSDAGPCIAGALEGNAEHMWVGGTPHTEPEDRCSSLPELPCKVSNHAV